MKRSLVATRPCSTPGRFAAAALLTLALLLGPACAAPAARDPIRVGLSLALSGRFAAIAGDQEKGYRLWERDVNQGGGLLGRDVEVVIRDDASDPREATAIYERLVDQDRVDFLFGPYSSMISHAVLPVAARHRIPIIIGGAAADSLWEQGYPNVVGAYTPASKFTLGFFELLVWQGLDRVALLSADDSFSSDLAESAEQWMRRFGLQLVHRESFTKGTTRLDEQARSARERGAQALVVCGHLDEAVHMRAALKRIAWTPGAYYASVGPALPAFLERCGPDAEGVFATSLWEPHANFPGARGFLEDFKAAYGAEPGYHAALAYATGQVWEAAVRQAGSADRAGVLQALLEMDIMTIIGRYGVDDHGKQVRQHTFIIQWQNGTKQIVWPPEIQTAPAAFH